MSRQSGDAIREPVYASGSGKLVRRIGSESPTAVEDLVSYAVGCMFGRYSLDEPG